MRLFSDEAPGASVVAVMTNDPATIELLLGAIRCGATLVSLPIPARGTDVESYLELVRSACSESGADAVVARDDIARMLLEAGIPARSHSSYADGALAAGGGEFELVQHSSGSTGAPKAIRLSDSALGLNISRILQRVEPTTGDVTVTWLPVSHDMGLIGMVLTSIAAGRQDLTGGVEVVILNPVTFLRDPSAWLAALDQWSGTFTAAPDFGYRLAAERSIGKAWDLRRVRCAITGGEIIRRETIEAFTSQFSSCGFEAGAICPAYGMAEFGLAVALTPVGQMFKTVAVNARSVALDNVDIFADTDATIVSSGPALHDYNISISSDLSPHVGPISVAGPSLGRDAKTGRDLGVDGKLKTGDLGFILDDWVYVCGRHDDYFVAHGRNIFAPHVEARVNRVDGVRKGRAAAIGLLSGDWVVIVEAASETDSAARDRIRSEVARAASAASAVRPADVQVVERGTLPVTPSGKLRRGELFGCYLKHIGGDV
jgi:fatty-acyl-CoA synthase